MAEELFPKIHLQKVISEKVKQKIELLLARATFHEDVSKIRSRHETLIHERERLAKNVDGVLFNGNPLGSNFQKNLDAFLGFNTEPVEGDAVELARKYNLRPLESWACSLVQYILDGSFIPHVFYAAEAERVATAPYANCQIKTAAGVYGDKRIILELDENATLQDIKDVWPDVRRAQSTLRCNVGSKRKHFYPLKNLGNAVQLRELDKRIESDWEKQEELYGPLTGDPKEVGKTETKRRKNLRQLRRRYKNRIT